MRLSLATWSLHPLLFQQPRTLEYLDVPALVRERWGLDALELNNLFFVSREPAYLRQFAAAAHRAQMSLLNMAVDEKADLCSADPAAAQQAVALYGQWIPVAADLGMTAIRANTGGREIADTGPDDPVRLAAEQRCIDGLRRLCDLGSPRGVAILVENHRGLSSDPDSVVRLMNAVRQSHGADACGTVVDWGNWPDTVDRWSAIAKVLPFAMAVHAKIKAIGEDLSHPAFDLARCVEITRAAGYTGHLGIEYEGGGDALTGVDRAVRKLRELVG